MGKPKKFNDTDLIQIVDDYYAFEACGDAERLKYSKLAEYGVSLNLGPLRDYSFSRSPAVVQHIEDLKAGRISVGSIPPVSQYVRINAAKTVSRFNDLGDYVSFLQKMDNRCAELSDSVNTARDMILAIRKERDLLRQELEFAKQKLQAMEKAGGATGRNDVTAQKYSAFVRDYVFTDIAEYVYLMATGKKTSDGKVMTKEGLDKLIQKSLSQRTAAENTPAESGEGNADIVHLRQWLQEKASPETEEES